MTSTLDDSIRSALAAVVGESPALGPVPTNHDVQIRQAMEPARHPRGRIMLAAVTLFVACGLGALAVALRGDSGDEPVPPLAPAITTDVPATPDGLGYLSVPTMEGGAFVVDGDEPRFGLAVHDPATALPQDAKTDVSVIFVGREQFGPLEELVVGDEIGWRPTGASADLAFTVTGVHSYVLAVDPATTATNGLIVVTDPSIPKTGQRIVITAQPATSPTATDGT